MYILPDYIKKIISKIEENGYEAYIVGGAVRNMLLGISPDDYDITTSCTPDVLCNIFQKTVNTGIKHGTVTVITDGGCAEVTTYRIDGQYHNHRSPEMVKYVSRLQDDLARRDFTINAMAYNEKTGIIDLFGGKNDLKNKIIRCVGEPNLRFKEDALRMLRAIRFASRYNFKIEAKTYDALVDNLHLLKNISNERIYSELIKTLTSPCPSMIESICNNGGFIHLKVNKISNAQLLDQIDKLEKLRFYTFIKLCEVNTTDICNQLKTDNNMKKYCTNFDMAVKISTCPDKVQLKRIMRILGIDEIKEYLNFIHIIYNTNISSSLQDLKDILNNKEPYKISDLCISGEILTKLGYSGRQVGDTLEKLLEIVIRKPELNNTKYLMSLIN